MDIVIVGETQIHRDHISIADDHVIKCSGKIATGPNFARSAALSASVA